MRAPSDKSSTDKRIDDKAAIEEARRHLRPLFVNAVAWSERGADTRSPEKEFRSAIALVECALSGAEGALNEALKCALNEKAANTIANTIPFIEFARRFAIPVIKRGRPARGRHGRYGDLNASRNRTIAEPVALICNQFELSQEQVSSIVSEALKSLVREHRRVFRRLIKERGADPAWIEECLKFVDELWLSEDTVEGIAKKHRT